ncbi:hypothetical protein HA402_001988 [Bradysia odoriphaga]|nr:hypothetical protein HA402_001988 [Bradysia odoriphaga]
MSLVRNAISVLRFSSAYKSPILWTRLMSSTPVPSQPEAPKPKPVSGDPAMGDRATHKPDNLERRFLVWTGRYKTIDDVPEYVNQQTMERTRNQVRIKGANIMILLTIMGCIYAVYSGKKAAEQGESVEKLNLDWHTKYNESKTKST